MEGDNKQLCHPRTVYWNRNRYPCRYAIWRYYAQSPIGWFVAMTGCVILIYVNFGPVMHRTHCCTWWRTRDRSHNRYDENLLRLAVSGAPLGTGTDSTQARHSPCETPPKLVRRLGVTFRDPSNPRPLATEAALTAGRPPPRTPQPGSRKRQRDRMGFNL